MRTREQQMTTSQYGVEDASFQAAGGEAGILKLVEAFFGIWSNDPMPLLFVPCIPMN